jgi:hypothetical protein
LLDLRYVDADGGPFVFACGLRLGDALALPSSMISRSHVATPARMVSMSLLVGLWVYRRSPPMYRTTRPLPRFDRSASMDNSSAVLRAGCRQVALLRRQPGLVPWFDYDDSREIVAPLTL